MLGYLMVFFALSMDFGPLAKGLTGKAIGLSWITELRLVGQAPLWVCMMKQPHM